MPGFNYNKFKEALRNAEKENHARLMIDVEKVKAFVEKMLTLCLESSANLSRMNYPGVEL